MIKLYRNRLTAAAITAMAVCYLVRSAVAGPPALDPPAIAVLEEARAIVEAMKKAERGPYKQIRWLCKDGTVLPPTPGACRDHGGGHQHAEYSEARQRLASLGWSVGTILTSTSWAELWDEGRRNGRLRELALERYLVDVDDGWVLRRARYYRGRVQVEDEEHAGRAHLLRILSQPDWMRDNFLLARESVRTLPHHGGSDRTRAVRRLSQELAEKDRSFERLRIKIHTSPGTEDLESTRDWVDEARRRGAKREHIDMAEHLITELEALYGRAGRMRRLETARLNLGRVGRGKEISQLLEGVIDAPPVEQVRLLSELMRRVREIVAASPDASTNLLLMDLSIELEQQLIPLAVGTIERDLLSRHELLVVISHLIDAAYGSGSLSGGEREALAAPLQSLEDAKQVSTAQYLEVAVVLRRATAWATGGVRYTFAEPLVRYGALEPKALRFPEELMRGSPLLPLAEAIRRISVDAETRAGLLHRLLGRRYAGVLGLNPGVATGRLRVPSTNDLDVGLRVSRDEIVLLPHTVPELKPVAGILTLAEGNLLSHIQMLARNMGIPNASVPLRSAGELTAADGTEVMFVVGSDGSVILERLDRLPVSLRGLVASEDNREPAPARLDAPAPDLSVCRPLPLGELHAALAGRVVGPKAANLGELARRFPGRVAPAMALPFGIFAEHVSAGSRGLKTRLDSAYKRHRAGEIDEATLASEIEAVRVSVAALTLKPSLRESVSRLMEDLFGPPGTYGVFVRSDTNVEDLPGFTGAGLNETVPNVVGLDRLMAAVPRVWSSVYAARAIAWRGTLLKRPEEVYSSVLIMKSVPADKSGVMATVDLATRTEGLTVASAWGVGGAVDGEAAETLVLRGDGPATLIAEAKAPYRRRLREEGGVDWIAARAGSVLTEDEQRALRDLAAEVSQRLVPAPGQDGRPAPWDIEFGFVNGRLTLFQIRPLVERGQARADRILRAMATPRKSGTTTVRLADQPELPDTVFEPSSVMPSRTRERP